MPKSSGWPANKRNDPEFQCAREGLIEDFLTHVELEMARQGVSRTRSTHGVHSIEHHAAVSADEKSHSRHDD